MATTLATLTIRQGRDPWQGWGLDMDTGTPIYDAYEAGSKASAPIGLIFIELDPFNLIFWSIWPKPWQFGCVDLLGGVYYNNQRSIFYKNLESISIRCYLTKNPTISMEILVELVELGLGLK